jgi:hypothetical protein
MPKNESERFQVAVDATPLLARLADPVLEPMDRISEVLFGLIMALTFTLTLGVVTAGDIAIRTMLMSALGCNLAWGIIDAAVFFMARVNEQGHNIMKLREVRKASIENVTYAVHPSSRFLYRTPNIL